MPQHTHAKYETGERLPIPPPSQDLIRSHRMVEEGGTRQGVGDLRGRSGPEGESLMLNPMSLKLCACSITLAYPKEALVTGPYGITLTILAQLLWVQPGLRIGLLVEPFLPLWYLILLVLYYCLKVLVSPAAGFYPF